MTEEEPDLLTGVEQARTIALIAFPGMTPLDLVGPLQVLSQLGAPYEVVVVAASTEPMATDTALNLQASHTFDQVRRPYAVFVPGGTLGAIRAMADPQLQDYLHAVCPGASLVGSVCTGSLILAAAGLLEGKRATTHWSCMEWLRKLGAHPVQERWVEDGKYTCAAGVSAGIDWAIALVAKLRGDEAARAAQIMIEYDPDPPLGWIDWDDSAEFERLQPWIDQAMAGAGEALAGRPDLKAKLGL
jgi:transcriptional regulator GlxA family with amidase domain